MQPKSTYSKKIFAVSITSLLLLAFVPSMTNANAVTTAELCIAIDRSGSIGQTNLNTILAGIKASFLESNVQSAAVGSMIKLSVVSFGNTGTTDISSTTIMNAQDVTDFANLVGALGLTTTGPTQTNTGEGIQLCVAEFDDPTISTINIITDGVPTVGPNAQTEANTASNLGIVINALAIGTVNQATLDGFVDGPPAGMTFQTPDIMGFEEAFMEKLMFELNIPVAGELLSIDASALLISGFMMNALWILPTLAATGIAGTGLYLTRSRWNKTSEE